MGNEWQLWVAETPDRTAVCVDGARSLVGLSPSAEPYVKAGYWSIVAVHDDGQNPATYWLLDGQSSNIRRGRWTWIA